MERERERNVISSRMLANIKTFFTIFHFILMSIPYWMWKCLLLEIILHGNGSFYKIIITIIIYRTTNIPMRKKYWWRVDRLLLGRPARHMLDDRKILMFNVVSTMKIWWASIFSLKWNENTAQKKIYITLNFCTTDCLIETRQKWNLYDM